MPDLRFWFTGTSVFLAFSFAFAIGVGLIGIRDMVSRQLFYVLITCALILAGLAWRTAAKQESDSAAQATESQNLKNKLDSINGVMQRLAESLSLGRGQSASDLANEIITKLSPVWELTAEQKTLLKQALVAFPPQKRFKIRILVVPSSSQASTFGNSLISIFADSGWNVEGISDFTLTPELTGVSIVVPSFVKQLSEVPEMEKELAIILGKAKIDMIFRPPGSSTAWDSPAIAVGRRP